MDYETALQWWFNRVDFEKRPAGRDEIKLDRMRSLMHRLGNPQDQLKIVHVAGSKGKGSTSAMIAACAQAAGHRVGLFTSPHLSDVRERIQVNNVPISNHDLSRRLTELHEAVTNMESAGQPPTFFEVGTAAAFHHFQQTGVDLAVIEVGLGGRFDATNVCMPSLSVITSISYDHTAILGDKLSQIAFEKAGIIKPGIPVVSGVDLPEASDVIRKIAAERNAPLTEIEKNFQYSHVPGRVDLSGIIVKPQVNYEAGDYRRKYSIGLLGSHQAANAATAIAALRQLRNSWLTISDNSFSLGLAQVEWPARMEVFSGKPLIVLDCAHNVASAQALVKTLQESFPICRKGLVFASSSDKDVSGILNVLEPHFDRIVMTQFGVNSRAVAAIRLAELLSRHDVQTTENSQRALEKAIRMDVELIVITGSVFLAGELRPFLQQPRK